MEVTQNQTYYERNKERIKARMKQYRIDNPDCHKKFLEKHPDYTKQWRKNNPTKVKRYTKQSYLKHHYKITIENKNTMREKQNYCCASCKRSEQEFGYELRIDHDHRCCPGKATCGKCIRGLLCDECNLTIGNAKDNPTLLHQAADYLERWKS